LAADRGGGAVLRRRESLNIGGSARYLRLSGLKRKTPFTPTDPGCATSSPLEELAMAAGLSLVEIAGMCANNLTLALDRSRKA